MAERRAERRVAERKARDVLGSTLVAAAADVGEAWAALTDAMDAIGVARQRGEELVRAAARQAADLVADAGKTAAEAETHYASQWEAARRCGWAPAQLRTMGYTAPKRRAPSGRAAGTPASGTVEVTSPGVDRSPETASTTSADHT